jgi:T5orf172 domain
MPLSIVYVVTNPAMPGLVKIGRTSQEEAQSRLVQLYSTGVPFPFKLEFACKVHNPDEVEAALHIAFAPNRVNPRREFFQIEASQAIAILKLLHTEDATTEVTAGLSSSDQSDAAAGEVYRATRRPNLNFIEMGIPVGSQLVSTESSDVVATVVGPKKVKFGDDEMSLTAATRKVLGLEYAVQPGPYWMFNGRLLREIYNETYPLDE